MQTKSQPSWKQIYKVVSKTLQRLDNRLVLRLECGSTPPMCGSYFWRNLLLIKIQYSTKINSIVSFPNHNRSTPLLQSTVVGTWHTGLHNYHVSLCFYAQQFDRFVWNVYGSNFIYAFNVTVTVFFSCRPNCN